MSEKIEFIAANALPVLEAETPDVLAVDPATGEMGRVPGANLGKTPDWNAAEGEPGHVLNRTHYSEMQDVELVNAEWGAADGAEEDESGNDIAPYWYEYDWFEMAEGEEYIVVLNGVSYDCVSVNVDGDVICGNPAIWMGSDYEDNGMPFAFYGGEFALMENIPLSLKISRTEEITVTIPPKYLPPAEYDMIIQYAETDIWPPTSTSTYSLAKGNVADIVAMIKAGVKPKIAIVGISDVGSAQYTTVLEPINFAVNEMDKLLVAFLQPSRSWNYAEGDSLYYIWFTISPNGAFGSMQNAKLTVF